jgi:hypothetical protein
MNKISGKFNFVLIAALIFISTFIILSLFWSIDKGFDFRDEGLFYAYSQPDVDNYNAVINYDLFFKFFYNLTGLSFGIIGLRVLKLSLIIIMLVSSIPLFRSKNITLFNLLFLFIAFFTAYTATSKSISYYSLTLFFVYIYYLSVEFLFKSKSFKGKIYIYVILGILSALSFMVKPPVGLALAIVGFCLLFFVYNLKQIRLILFTLIAFVFSFFIIHYFFSFYFPYYSFFNVLENGFELSSMSSSYSKSIIVKRVIAGLKWSFLITLSGYLVANTIHKKNGFFGKSFQLVVGLCVLVYFYLAHYKSNEFSIFQYSLVLSIAFLIGITLNFNLKYFDSLSKILIITLLYVFPFICILGSNMYFFRLGQSYMIFWILIIVLMNEDNIRSILFPKVVCLLLSCFIAIKVYDSNILHPFNQQPLTNSFAPFRYIGDHLIKLHPDDISYLNELKIKIIKYNKSNLKILGIYAFTGDILMAGFKPYFNPLIWENNQLEYCLKKSLNNTLYPKAKFFLLRNNEKSLIPNLTIMDSVKNRDEFVFIAKENN